MRVPSIGLPLDERRIVREGYRLAARMLAGYADKPTLLGWAVNGLDQMRLRLTCARN